MSFSSYQTRVHWDAVTQSWSKTRSPMDDLITAREKWSQDRPHDAWQVTHLKGGSVLAGRTGSPAQRLPSEALTWMRDIGLTLSETLPSFDSGIDEYWMAPPSDDQLLLWKLRWDATP